MALDLVAIKQMFFDTKAVASKLDPAVKKALSKFGAFVRKRDRSSIKRRKGTSLPGSPPFAHQGDIKRILFGYDAQTKSVVIGAVLFGSQSGAPETLEEGGFARLKRKIVRVAARPHTLPAFQTELGKVGGNFKNLIRG